MTETVSRDLSSDKGFHNAQVVADSESEVLTQIRSLIVASHSPIHGFHGCNPGRLIWSSWPCELLEGVQLDKCPTLLCTCEHPNRSCTESRLFQGQKQFVVLFLPPSLPLPPGLAQHDPLWGKPALATPWMFWGVDLGSIWGRFGGSFWGRFGVDLGSIWGRFGVKGRFGVDLGSIWGRFGVDLGSIWGRFGVAVFLSTEPTVEIWNSAVSCLGGRALPFCVMLGTFVHHNPNTSTPNVPSQLWCE